MLAQRLRSLRLRCHLTQAQAAARAGVAASTWACWEQGRRTPRLRTLPHGAAAVGATMADLLGGTRKPLDYA